MWEKMHYDFTSFLYILFKMRESGDNANNYCRYVLVTIACLEATSKPKVVLMLVHNQGTSSLFYETLPNNCVWPSCICNIHSPFVVISSFGA